MAGISFDFRNIVSTKKCAVSSRIVNLDIGDESPRTSESAFEELFFNDQVSENGVNNGNLFYECDKLIDKNFLIHSQSPLSASICDARLSDKVKSPNGSDIDFGLQDLLNAVKLEQSAESRNGKLTSKINKSDNKMKIISNCQAGDNLSHLLSPVVNGSPWKNNEEYGKDLPNMDTVKNECADSLSWNNSLMVENNLSDLLSSIIKEDSDVTKAGSFNSMHNLKVAKEFKMENESNVADLSDLLSSIDLENSNDNKVGSCDRGKISYMNNVKTRNEPWSSDLLPSDDTPTSEKEPCITYMSDLLSSIDFGDSNGSKVGNYDQDNNKIVNSKDELCLSDLLSSTDLNKPAAELLNSKPLRCDTSNLYFQDPNDLPDSLNDLNFDTLSCSSTSNSSASSYNESENNSPKDSLTKSNLLTDKIFESDSGYSSFDSVQKEFSFFDYSSDNQFSFNTLLTKSADASTATKHHDIEDTSNINDEMSMCDLMTIVSPEFKNPVLATLNKTKILEDHVNNYNSDMLDLIETSKLKLKNSNSQPINNNSVDCEDKFINSDCVDGRISKHAQSGVKVTDLKAGLYLKKDISVAQSDLANKDIIASDDEQIIDLRECIKSAKQQFTRMSPIKQVKSVEKTNLECFSPNKNLFHSEDKSPLGLLYITSNPFEINDTIPRKKSRVNTKQTMFSKALACKPKKDHSLLQKVADIKNELLNNIINRPVFINCDVPQPIVETVLQSDRCDLLNVGRKSFGLPRPCEFQ